MEPVIKVFLEERKSLWLKKKVKSNTPEAEKLRLEQESNDLFSLANWLPDASRRAGQLTMVSHPAKFSHPNAKTTAIIVDAKYLCDGLLRSGNVTAKLDTFGNAAALDVQKLLSLKLYDNQTILTHLEKDTDTIRQQFTIPTATYDEISSGLLAIKQGDNQLKTHGGIKQVYFPVDDNGYHLLSILTPSGIVFELKSRINEMRFSDSAKASREARKSNRPAQDYSEIFNLTLIGYGGSKPQNISVLNNQNGGVAYLLNATPPVLKGRRLNPPRRDFFDFEYTRPEIYKDLFDDFHKTLSTAINNKALREKIKWQAKAIFFELIDRSWLLRYLEPGWSESDRYQRLPQMQKLWLDAKYRDAPEKNEDWLSGIQEKMIRWFRDAYKKQLAGQSVNLADYEFIELKKWLESCGEGLK
jgi:CRISPR-associated protein Csy1